jgi:hypothetical protein
MLWPFYLKGKRPKYTLYRSLGGSHRRSGLGAGDRKISAPDGNLTVIPRTYNPYDTYWAIPAPRLDTDAQVYSQKQHSNIWSHKVFLFVLSFVRQLRSSAPFKLKTLSKELSDVGHIFKFTRYLKELKVTTTSALSMHIYTIRINPTDNELTPSSPFLLQKIRRVA